ncbi:hypothetical protein ACWCO9_29585 [Streptomyces sp. NPDC001937]
MTIQRPGPRAKAPRHLLGGLPGAGLDRLPPRLPPEHGEQWADPSAPAFVGIDRHGHITGGLVPDSVTRAVRRIWSRQI